MNIKSSKELVEKSLSEINTLPPKDVKELNEKNQREVEQKLQNQRTGGVCFEDALDLQEGVDCSNKHF